MADQNELLMQRRRAALAARKTATPVVEPAEVPPTRAKVQPLKPPKTPVQVVDDDDGDDDEDTGITAQAALHPMTGVASVAAPRRSALPVIQQDRTRSMDSSDIIMPKLRLSQAMSKVNADDIVRQGNYYHSLTNENLGKTVLVVPVDMRKSRSRFVQGSGLLCRSFDLLMGEGDPGMPCEGTQEEIDAQVPPKHRGCPLRLWGERDANGRSTPPECSINYNYPLLILDPDDLENGPTRRALYTLRGTATPVARLLNSIVTESQTGRWHDVILELGVQPKTNPKGTFFVPTVRYVGQTAGATLERARTFASQVTASVLRASIEDDRDD